MAVSDYKTVADQNTTISGINIAEGCPPSGINNAIRQLMADIKAKTDAMDTASSTAQAAQATKDAAQDEAISAAQTSADAKLPLSGGTMTGAINLSVSRLSNEGGTRVYLRSAYGYEDKQSLLCLANGADGQPGFTLRSANGSAYVDLIGTPDGILTWNTKDVVTVDSSGDGWIRYSNGIQICFYYDPTNNYYATGVGKSTYRKAFSSRPAVIFVPQQDGDSGNYHYSIREVGTSYFNYNKFFNGVLTSNTPYGCVIAIGHWK